MAPSHLSLTFLFLNKLFDTIRAKEPDFEQNVVAMSGDVCEPMLGLSDDDVRIIAEHVSVVFHVAATVRFDEALK